MKVIAAILNIGLVVFVLIIVEFDKLRATEFLGIAAFLAFVTINLLAIFGKGSKGWIRAFLERKSLEEAKRIKSLRSELETNAESD